MLVSKIISFKSIFIRTILIENTFTSKYSIYSPLKKYKIICCEHEMLSEVKDSSTILIGGFGLCGMPEYLVKLLEDKKAKDLTVICTRVGCNKYGLQRLLKKNKIKRLITSSGGENAIFQKQFKRGEIEVEFVPLGTLTERIRAGGAGIPAFFISTGSCTLIHDGEMPFKYDVNGKVAVISKPRESRLINGKCYIMEEAIVADVALIKAWKGDSAGNLVFKKSARNINPTMAKAAKTTVAEVELLVTAGEIPPDEIHLPGIYVNRVVQSPKYTKRIENIVVQKSETNTDSVLNRSLGAKRIRQMIQRLIMEFKDGMYINLGSGLPLLVTNDIPSDLNVFVQSEAGIVGLGPSPQHSQVDPELINGSSQTATIIPGSSFCSTDEAFDMIRGGHVNLIAVGALEVSQHGDISGWMIPGTPVKNLGPTMDLVNAPGAKIIACMKHTGREGRKKIVEQCTLPITGNKCVKMIITDKAVFTVHAEYGLTLIEVAAGAAIEDILMTTGCNFQISEGLRK